ncbi:MAG TPA: hypothetical protein VJ810_20770 [Blastocatellia bacterium]|nr:hypothetical protein [Blastocatellia bacterium]
MTVSPKRTTDKPLSAVRESLQAYADRGVFRGFSEIRNGRFQFVWVVNHRMELSVDAAKHELRFRQLLPNVPAKSELYAELKSFIQQRHDRELPEHRRVDRKRAEVSCTNRGGFVSVSLKVKNNQYAYGVNRIVNVAHELFLHLRERRPEYLMENFDVPQE